MTWVIRLGGALVILAVCTIFIFLCSEIVPLFASAKVSEERRVALPPGDWLTLGSNESGSLASLVSRDGRLATIPTDPTSDVSASESRIDLGAAKAITTAQVDTASSTLLLGLDDGRFQIHELRYGVEGRSLSAAFEYRFTDEPHPVLALAYRDSGATKLAAGILDLGDGRREVRMLTLEQKIVLGKKGPIRAGINVDLTPLVAGQPQRVLVDDAAESVIVTNDRGEISYFHLDQATGPVLRQRFSPFPEGSIASINYLNGGVSLVLTSVAGDNTIWSLYRHGDVREFGEITRLEPFPGGASCFDRSTRNKAYVLAKDEQISLRYATTHTVRWAGVLADGHARHVAMSGKSNRLLVADDQDQLHVLSLYDRHPEAGWSAFFGKLWYEGFDAPSYQWQSTGGTDMFESKFSLVPLIIGSLKGTLFALLFAVPIALLAAIYCSEFMRPTFKLWVKPVIEIMASLPSVVLGFFAALWLAPLIETKVPTIFCAVIGIPISAMLFGWTWTRLPRTIRTRLRPGYEFLVFGVCILPLVLGAAALAGPILEQLICRVTDPVSGIVTSDFRLWWPRLTNCSFDQRNSLVVGFVMGFAVIPIIFTISEDALTGVPPTLRSGSLAMGASRWQTAIRVIVPTASPGIFSAGMIGFGRAVGETMIMVMATGNTPVMDLNIFSGMRTLAANIAVELSEAPEGGTLFRTLFLGAMMLFMITFVINTVAEIVRQRLRERYKTV